MGKAAKLPIVSKALEHLAHLTSLRVLLFREEANGEPDREYLTNASFYYRRIERKTLRRDDT